LGTFTAILGSMGDLNILAFLLCYCFWGCMFMPMLAVSDHTYRGNDKRHKESSGSN
jgi:hypothetical protein